MTNPAIKVAQEITAQMPAKPKSRLFGGEAHRLAQQAYSAHYAAAIGAWRYAAQMALNNAIASQPEGWFIDYDNHKMILGCHCIEDLEAMCDANYPWNGRRADQV